MSREQNIKNLKTEKEGIKVLKSLNSNFFVPSTDERKYIYKKFQLDYSKYSRSVDGIILNVDSIDRIKSLDDFLFVEIKTTKSKSVKKLPYGVFFGLTKNEEDLFKSLKNFRLCIVHVTHENYCLVDYNEYLSLIQNKRIQYQINFKSKGSL
ncbi:hypothetical protein N9T55_00080 [Flavobacteriaceae bacterium]|nr:hypothetical protein [Flavobacteriaceae bacterium]